MKMDVDWLIMWVNLRGWGGENAELRPRFRSGKSIKLSQDKAAVGESPIGESKE